MKTLIWILSTASLEVPWPVVVILALAALAFLWLILRKGFILHFKGRDKEIDVTTQHRAEKQPEEIRRYSSDPPASPPRPEPPSDSKRAA